MTKHGVCVRQDACEAFKGQGLETGLAADFNWVFWRPGSMLRRKSEASALSLAIVPIRVASAPIEPSTELSLGEGVVLI